MITLQDYLEKYLQKEGIYEIIPEDRRQLLFSLPIAAIWFIGLWLSAAYFIISKNGISSILFSIIIPPIILLLTITILLIPYAVYLVLKGKSITQNTGLTLGIIIMIGVPLLFSIILGNYLHSATITFIFLLIYILLIVILIILNSQSYRILLILAGC